MNNKEFQHISIIKMEQNIKLNNQVFKNDKLLTSEQSVFLMENGKMSTDALFKIKVLEKETPNTIITAICEDSDQLIVDRHSTKNKNDASVLFDLSHNIVLNHESIKTTKLFYNNGSIDYLISPFTILNEELIQSPIENSLNIFIFNNTLYSIVLNDHKRLAYSTINFLTPYVDIKKSNFYTDEMAEQILYDEIYLLELSSNIEEIVTSYSEFTKSANICESVNIYYAIKYLEAKQLEILKENVGLDITYNHLNIDEAVETITKKHNIEHYSFTKRRAKKSKLALFMWLLLVLLTTAGAGYAGYYYLYQNGDHSGDETKQEVAKIEYANLPNHITINQNMIKLITNLFESIDDNSVLKEIQIAKDESTIIYDFKGEDPYQTSLKPKLLKLYETSENILTSQTKGVFTSIISNTHPISKDEIVVKKYIPTKTTKFLSSSQGKKGLEQLFNTSTIVKLLGETKEKYTTYKYSIYTIVKSPVEFFEVVKLLEKQKYSIALDYPIEFAKTKKGLELNFRITINQNNELNKTADVNQTTDVENNHQNSVNQEHPEVTHTKEAEAQPHDTNEKQNAHH